MTELDPKLFAYAKFHGRIRATIDCIDWVNLSVDGIKKYLNSAVDNLEKELEEIRKNDEMSKLQ